MRWLFSAFLLFVFLQCSKPAPTLEGIDWEVWKNDRDACQNQRIQFLTALETQREKLKALSEMDIIRLMGKPDQNELYKRNQKFYYYFLTPGTNCTQPDSAAKRLILRFNAIGLAKEVSIE